MLLYLSGFEIVNIGWAQIKSSAMVAGASGPFLELRTNLSSPVGWNITLAMAPIPVLPGNVSLLVDLDAPGGLDANVPNVIRNRVNNALGTNLTGTITWRQMIVALMTVEGSGKWGTLRAGELQVIVLGPLRIDVS